MTEEEIEKIRSANEKAERENVPKKPVTTNDRIDLIQGSLRLSAVAALFCAQPESLEVFKAWVKKMKLYPEQNWITTPVLAKASCVTVEHSNAGDELRGMAPSIDGIVDRMLDALRRG